MRRSASGGSERTLGTAGLVLLATLAAPALAQAEEGTVALSPAARAAAIDAASRTSNDDVDAAPINGRSIHGEMGLEVGSRGERALYGSTVVPLGQTGTAAFSFMTGKSGRWPRR